MAQLKRLLSLSGFLQLLAVVVAAGILSIFSILQAWPITLPTTYNLKTTQQIVNFLVLVFATGAGILLKDCFDRTNEAQTAASLEASSLTLGRFEMHYHAARKSVLKLTKSVTRGRTTRSRSTTYIVCISTYTTISWVLSVIFIVELHWAGFQTGVDNFANVRLPVSMPVSRDACVNSTGTPNCYYNLASAPLSTLLVAQNFTSIAGMRYTPIFEGPQGVPYDILDHFVSDAGNTTFPDMQTQYCAPSLMPKAFSCKQDTNNTRVRYEYFNIFNSSGMYKVSIDPDTPGEAAYPRPASASGDISTWTIASSRLKNRSLDTIITARGNGARLLSKMAWLDNPAPTNNSSPFTMVCTLNASYHWTWQTYTYTNNIFAPSAFNAMAKPCSNDPALSPRAYALANDPFVNIPAAIEGATDAIGSITGYSKLLNLDAQVRHDDNTGKDMRYSQMVAGYGNMTELELYLSVIYGTVMTMYSSSLSDGVERTPIRYFSSTYTYQISTSWTVLTVLAQVAAGVIFVCTMCTAVGWVRAVMSVRHEGEEKVDLLEPLQLMAYTVGNADEIGALMRDMDGELKVPEGDGLRLGRFGVVSGNDTGFERATPKS